MTTDITPGQEVTFTIARMPRTTAQRKTIERLMGMQPHVQKGYRKLATKRRLHDNRPYIRAGKMWTDRARCTKLARCEQGATFTLRVTPQIIPDIQSVSKFLGPS